MYLTTGFISVLFWRYTVATASTNAGSGDSSSLTKKFHSFRASRRAVSDGLQAR